MQCHALVSRIGATLSDSCTGPLLARACFCPIWVLVCASVRSVLRQGHVSWRSFKLNPGRGSFNQFGRQFPFLAYIYTAFPLSATYMYTIEHNNKNFSLSLISSLDCV